MLRTLLLLLPSVLPAQTTAFPPGFVDPEPVLRAAEEAVGTRKLRCVTLNGTAYTGMVGQQKEAGWNVDWPRGVELTNYTRTMNWEARTMKEEFDRKPGQSPASWKYGQGWLGGTPLQQNPHQLFYVNGSHGWHLDGATAKPVAAPPADAERWQVDLWINPHGFLKAARLPGANPRAFWRWELGEMGRDGATTIPEKVTVVSITLMGKYRVDATINKEHLLQRIHTWVPDPVLGDMNYEHEFSNDTYIDLGDGIRFPTVWHHHDGWDDNYNTQTISAGHNGFGGVMKNVRANVCPDAATVPDGVRTARFDTKVEPKKLAEGVYLMGGGSHNSVAVEFKDWIAVVEAPLDETRSLAVIDAVTKLMPNKPIRYLVNTHQHFDHVGGLRTYMHIGATILTHFKNHALYNRDVLVYTPRTLQPDLMALAPPTEVTEGYQYETIRENYVLTDGARQMLITYVQPLAHVEGMLMAFLPHEKIAIEADLADVPLTGTPTPANRAFLNHVRRLRYDIRTLAPVHGPAISWSEFETFMGR
ncbi:MAG: MBL fold metallo-hydrolase [Bryobacterales bacterium]|nr:MBL fold metallo-hydrolase [Bryobacterales bacterium]